MLNEMFSSSTIPVLEQWVNFAQSRHNILATNVANIDVPEQFQEKLQDAIETKADDGSLSPTGSRIGVDPFGKVKRELNGILYHDQSNVGLEQQVAEITKNHLQHNLALSLLNSQFRVLQSAVSERA